MPEGGGFYNGKVGTEHSEFRDSPFDRYSTFPTEIRDLAQLPRADGGWAKAQKSNSADDGLAPALEPQSRLRAAEVVLSSVR